MQPTMATSSHTSDRPCLPFRGVENDTSAYLTLDSRLKEIRCVALLPGSEDDDIICELMYTRLEETATPSSYTALSYCWGDINDTVSIRLRCPLTKQLPTSTATQTVSAPQYITIPYQITRNLYTALVALRRANTPSDAEVQCFWIDTLCINQTDSREKTHQVGFMGQVFSSAESVLVWVGPDDVYSV
jgi:hypothetical protein